MSGDLATQVGAFLLSQGVIGLVLFLIVFTGHLDPRRHAELAEKRTEDARAEAQRWRELFEKEQMSTKELMQAIAKERQQRDDVVEKLSKTVAMLEERRARRGSSEQKG